MIRFAELYHELDSSTKTNDKVAALVDFFSKANAEDAAWATFFLAGNRLKQLVPTKRLRQWAAEAANIPTWLFEESYHSVGDLAETISLIIPNDLEDKVAQEKIDNPPNDGNNQPLNTEEDQDRSLAFWILNELKPLGGLPESDQKEKIIDIWRRTNRSTRFVAMKLITGGFRVGVSKGLLIRSLSKYSQVTAEVIAHRLMGNWEPTAKSYQHLIDPDEGDSLLSQPYPFCLAHPIAKDKEIDELGLVSDFAAEWKWDGIRGQIIRRSAQSFLWSRGEMLMENTWPEIEDASNSLPDGTVIDGEILAAIPGGKVLPFDQLQRRIGRKRVGKKLTTEVPVIFHAFDLLEINGCDLRQEAFDTRRRLLEQLLDQVRHPNIKATDLISGNSWKELALVREQSRENLAEGLMIKKRQASYSVGRVQGTWWKWKVEPHTIDAVLIYAQKGHGRRANLFSDYTFAVWDEEKLVPFAKAYSGLSDTEIRKIDRIVRQNTNEAFGPVRSVTPTIVMEVAFEGLRVSKRHKCGVATRFPRMVRWRIDKQPKDANTLFDLRALLTHYQDAKIE